MIGVIVRKEIASNLLSYKFFIVILLASVLIFTSLFVMGRDFRARQADYQLIQPEPGQPIAVLPPNPLSVFAKGLDEAMTRSFEVGLTGVDARTGRSGGNPVFAFFPAPDFVYVVKIVLSLVALLFGFDLVSRERENGTLKLQLANALPRSTLMAGKWLGSMASLAVPFLLVTLIGIALLGLSPSFRLSGGQAVRLAFLLGLSLAYIALFLSLGLLVSALTRRSSSSLVILLVAWALLVFVLPNLGTLAARQVVPVPSVKALAEKRDQVWSREILLSYTDPEGRAPHLRAINEELDRMEEDYRVRFNRLVRLARAINRVSPAAGFAATATEAAGTGIGEESRLKREIIGYKNRVLPLLMAGSPGIPAFAYRYRSLGEVLAEGGLVDVAWLLAVTVLLFAAAYAAVAKADVR
jgi:ABC-type transport system involved in multi-copper enzyme maturation permease subunit